MFAQRRSREEWSSRRALTALAACVGALFLGYVALFFVPPARGEPMWGVQFSKAHATWLGLDWQRAYTALLDEVGVRSFRLGAYWNEVELRPGAFAFADVDWMLDEAARHGARVTLAVGRRLPRWPECHTPDWARQLPEPAQQERILAYVRATVERYRSHPAVAVWQVENEPLLSVFGECPPPDRAFTERAIALVRTLDPQRTILTTDSGELSMWIRTAAMGDLLGTTMYRVVWNPTIGYWRYDHIIPPAFYRVKAWFAGKPASAMVIAELQAEPWIPTGDIFTTPLTEQRRSMDATRFRTHIAFARATGFREAYLWGSEYWYWLRERHGDPSLWDAAQEVFRGRHRGASSS